MNSVASARMSVPVIASTIAVAISRIALVPRTPFELDEFLFMQSVVRFEPLKHHPHPPGYPLIAAFGKCFAAFGLDPFHALVAVSVISSIVGFVALVFAFREMLGDEVSAITGAALFYFSPAMLVDSTLPMSDPPALMFLALALWMAARWGSDVPRGSDVPSDARRGPAPSRNVYAALCFGAFASASIGCRPQYAIAILPMLLYVVLLHGMKRSWRDVLAWIAAFTFVSLVWFVPLVVATGGINGFLGYQLKQASYVALHDSFLSRSGRTQAEIVLRFVAHPWGAKWLSVPVLLLAVFGLVRLLRVRNMRVVPLCVVAAVHLTFSIVATDPLDGVRYVLPSMIAIALFVAAGIRGGQRWPQLVFMALFIAGSILYAAPILLVRAATDSPPVQAAAWAVRNLRPNAVVLYDQSLEPHAQVLLSNFRPTPVERGMAMYSDRTDVPLFLFADGGTSVPGSQWFEWKTPSDAFGKLTRDHYFTVAVLPIPPSRRFVPIAGVSAPERTREGEEWRWLAPLATLRLPLKAASHATIALRLPPEAAIESNDVLIQMNGSTIGRAHVVRGKVTTVGVSLSGPAPRVLVLRSANAYVPAFATSSRDPRKLGVQLVSIESR